MDKLITNNGYQCSLNGMTDDTALVTVIEGNDVTLDIQLTKYDTEQEIWKSYSLLGYDDVQCYLLTPNGTHIDLDTEVQLDGKVKAKAESYQLETNMTYGIGVDWKDDDNDLSVKAKGMVKVVRYSEVTEDYDIAVTDNATYISMGQLPQDAITPDELTVVLDNYVTNSSLDTTLNDYVQDSDLDNYVTDSDLSTVLEDYITEADMSQFVTNSELSTALQPYVSDSELSTTLANYATTQYVDNAISSIPGTDMSNYYTKSDIDTTLQSYVSDSELSTTLNPYITESELSTALNPYVTDNQLSSTLQLYITETELDTTLQSYIDETEFSSTLSSYATTQYVDEAIDSIPGGGSGVSEEDWDNSNEAIAKELTDNRLEHLSINDRFNNYYTIAQSDNRYPDKSWVNDKFVTIADDINRQEAIANALSTSVQSTTIHNIVQISQTDYDALTTKDTNTLYIII